MTGSGRSLQVRRFNKMQIMAVGLLLISLGAGLRALAPKAWSGDLTDGLAGLIMGLGLGFELMALIKMRRAG